MGIFVRAVITGFGMSLGRMIFDKAVERFSRESQPQRVVVVNAEEFQKTTAS